MEIKQVEVVNGEYNCDIGISVEEWKEILQNHVFDKYLGVLVKFYTEPHHKSTCKAIGEKYNVSPQSFNSSIIHFTKAVQKNLNRFEIRGVDGDATFWIIAMTGKTVTGGLFEWTLRPELVQAMEELNLQQSNYLQKVYDEAIRNNHWVFKDWFPFYKKCVQEYIEQAISGDWSPQTFKRLIKDTTGNGVSDLQQGNFTWDEYGKIKEGWDEIQQLIEVVARNNHISYAEYQKVLNLLSKHTSSNRPAGSNRVIAAFLPNCVTTVVNYRYLKEVLLKLKEEEPDYPRIENDWLRDNLNFIQYSNSKVNFIEPWHSSLFAWYLKEHFEQKRRQSQKAKAIMQDYIDLLLSNRNLILTGAPGTGKTYLAKEVAKQITGVQTDEELEASEQFAFVQFHPSYDYTDFVEGLRPTKPDPNGNIGFKLKNGVLKEFCRKAIINTNTSEFDEKYETFIDDLSENDTSFQTPTHKKPFKVEINSNRTCVAIPETDIGTRMSITKEMIESYCFTGKIRDWKPYTVPIAEYFKKNYEFKIEVVKEKKQYVIVIDEINRAEISKVFGELFFSIDPGYRGEKGKVKTQYSNLQEEGDVFKNGFYVPDNVYILGTMNDIDRSVETFDFAMRRRFAWKEIKADDRTSMWDGQIDAWKAESDKRMKSLNAKIESIVGLGEAFHIGPAYFLKLQNYNGDFDQLWKNHLEGVLLEYLRGMPNALKLLEGLKEAFDPTKEAAINGEDN